MKRFISFILAIVLFTVLGFHNLVMVFGDSIEMSMGNHVQMDSLNEKHHNLSIDDCYSICCIDNDFSNQGISNIQTQNNKKILNKLKYTFIELCFTNSLINEWALIGNISPPDRGIIIQKYNYISLIGIIKSNT
ncbi:MAG: hypothetical protein QM490_00275 [Candidatus Gracilibacteria bacterium]